MWLTVDEVGAHQLVMAWRMVFGVEFAKVGDSGVPVNLEVALTGAIPDPLEAHAYLLRQFLIDGVVVKSK